MSNFKDITGHKFGTLLVSGISHVFNKNSYWKCDCVCGCNKKDIVRCRGSLKQTSTCRQRNKYSEEEFLLAIATSNTLQEASQKLDINHNHRSAVSKKHLFGKYLHKLKPDLSHMDIRTRCQTGHTNNSERFYRYYMSNANRRKIPFTITADEFDTLVLQNCFYCQNAPVHRLQRSTNKNKYRDFGVVNGVDRIDSSLGYTTGNCVACCSICNQMKMDLSKDVFLNQIHKILAVHGAK